MLKNKKTFTFEITTTALCDMKCVYCFEGEKINPKKLNDNINVIINNIDMICKDISFQEQFDMVNITFWGGEPTLNHKLINELINYYYNKKIGNIDFNFMIYSNGYNLFNLEVILENLKLKNSLHLLTLQISYDGKTINNLRLDNKGNFTDNIVLLNFFKILKKYIIDSYEENKINNNYLNHLGLKATIPITHIRDENILENWKDFYHINQYVKSIDKYNKTDIQYSPTIDYHNVIPDEIKLKTLQSFENQIIKISKLEYEYYTKYKKFLMSWFNKKSMDIRSSCTAGYEMVAINLDGSINFCHGSMYLKNKSDLQIKDLNFLNIFNKDDIFNFLQFINTNKINCDNTFYNKDLNKDCINCEATYCVVCPVVLYDYEKDNQSNKENISFSDLMYINKSKILNCEYFKIFGKVDRSLQNIINIKNKEK